MKKLKLFIPILLAVLVLSCKNEKKEVIVETETMEEVTAERIELTVRMGAISNSTANGEAIFVEENGTVTMSVNFEGLSPKEHAIHLHENADCSQNGDAAGGHWNPTFEKHGKWGDAEGYHKGDIGNFTANDDGTGNLVFSTDQWCIGCGDVKKDIIGKAIIVHEGVDDFVTQPTGDAGGRISCGGIIR